jgi:hypothetical protein
MPASNPNAHGPPSVVRLIGASLRCPYRAGMPQTEGVAIYSPCLWATAMSRFAAGP